MTREQYFDDIIDFGDLISFCNDYGCDYCEDVIRSNDIGSHIDEDIRDGLVYNMWYEIRDALNYIEVDGYDWVLRKGSFEYEGMDNYEFEEMKESVANWADENDIFDREEEEEEAVDEESEEESAPVEPEIEVTEEEFGTILMEVL